MKRKLVRGKEFERKREQREKDEEDDEVNEDMMIESEEDDSSDDGSEAASEAASEEEEEAPLEKKRKVKGAMTAKDLDIMTARKEEEERVANIVPYVNKQRALIFSSRGITSRFRHLMEDMRALLPHNRKDVKHDTKRNLSQINDLCDMKACNSCIFFEARKSKDLYMWLSKTPNGPSVKFLVLNIHTMDELRLSGNCLKGARPLLSFSKEFEDTPSLQLIKEMFTQTFGTPRGHPKSKPFVDHVMTFTLLDGKIWFRHYQIVDSTHDPVEISRALKRGEETTKLVEIGPRFVLDLIKIFDESFGGRTLVENPEFQTPNSVRSELRRKKGLKYVTRTKAKLKQIERQEQNVLPSDPVRDVFRD